MTLAFRSSVSVITLNKLTITQPATGATLTIVDGATLTASANATVSGTNTGDQTTVSGNAGSATVLQTARTINGVSFNGSADITIAGASPSSAIVDIDFGTQQDSIVTLTVTGLTWVTTTKKWIANAADSSDHTIEETALEGVLIQIASVVNGVGFDVIASAPDGTTGIHRFEISGV
jgi:hypothetical protein